MPTFGQTLRDSEGQGGLMCCSPWVCVPSKGGRETGLSKPQSQLQASAGSHTEIGAQIFPLLTFPKI